MGRLLFLLALFCGSYATPQDLMKNVFTFPLATDISNVRLITNHQKPITASTLCLRFHSGLTRGQSLFSLATPSQSNALLLYQLSVGTYQLYIANIGLDFDGLPDGINEWNSVCSTWDSSTGLAAVWVNGKRSSRKILMPGASITGMPRIILGQDQDAYGGAFDQDQSFVGDVADVHLWDSVISPCEIRFYMEDKRFVPGNILNWNALEYTTTGTVFVEKSDFDKLGCC